MRSTAFSKFFEPTIQMSIFLLSIAFILVRVINFMKNFNRRNLKICIKGAGKLWGNKFRILVQKGAKTQECEFKFYLILRWKILSLPFKKFPTISGHKSRNFFCWRNFCQPFLNIIGKYTHTLYGFNENSIPFFTTYPFHFLRTPILVFSFCEYALVIYTFSDSLVRRFSYKPIYKILYF